MGVSNANHLFLSNSYLPNEKLLIIVHHFSTNETLCLAPVSHSEGLNYCYCCYHWARREGGGGIDCCCWIFKPIIIGWVGAIEPETAPTMMKTIEVVLLSSYTDPIWAYLLLMLFFGVLVSYYPRIGRPQVTNDIWWAPPSLHPSISWCIEPFHRLGLEEGVKLRQKKSGNHNYGLLDARVRVTSDIMENSHFPLPGKMTGDCNNNSIIYVTQV